MPTTAEYLEAWARSTVDRPRSSDEGFAKVHCVGCRRLIIFRNLNLEDPELEPTWCFCDICKETVVELLGE